MKPMLRDLFCSLYAFSHKRINVGRHPAVVVLVMAVVFLFSCKEIDYVEPYRWGTVQTLFNVKGDDVSYVADSIYEAEVLAGDVYYSNKKEFFHLSAQGGYPTIIYIKGYADYLPYPLDTSFALTIYIEPSTRIFSAVTNKISNDTELNPREGFFSFPEANAFLIKSNSPQSQLLSIMAYNYDANFNVKSFSFWGVNQIESKKVYISGVGSENQDKKFDYYIGGTLYQTGTERGNPLSSDTMTVTLTNPNNNQPTVYKYAFGGRNKDRHQNYTSVIILKDGLTIAKIERTIVYK